MLPSSEAIFISKPSIVVKVFGVKAETDTPLILVTAFIERVKVVSWFISELKPISRTLPFQFFVIRLALLLIVTALAMIVLSSALSVKLGVRVNTGLQ